MIFYEQSIIFTPEQFSTGGQLLPSALQTAFQYIGRVHAELLGLGYEAMLADGQIWVITKMKTRVIGSILPGKAYRLLTYPKPRRGMLYQRDFQLYDGADRVAIGISQWCIVDYASRKALRTDKDFTGEFNTEVLFPEGFDRFRPGVLTPAGNYPITDIDIDGNNHTNNTRYAHMVEQVLPGQGVQDFSIHFHKESRLGDVIDLYTGPWKDDKTIVCGKIGEDVIFTACL